MSLLVKNKKLIITSLWVLFAIVFWSGIFIGMAKVAPNVPNPGEVSQIFWSTSYLALLSGIVLVGTTLYVIDRWVKLTSSVAALFGMTLLFAALVHYTNQLPFHFLLSPLLIDIGLLGIGCHIGKIIALGVNQRSYLAPLSLVASVADLWSVWGGPTHVLLKQTTYWNYFLITYPLLGTNQILPTLGLGDITFLALYFSLIPQYNLRVRLTSWSIIVAFSGCFLLSLLAGKGLPVIPFISAAFLIVNWNQLEFKKEDIRVTFIFIGVFLITAFIFSHYLR
jgi:hypothetical protein